MTGTPLDLGCDEDILRLLLGAPEHYTTDDVIRRRFSVERSTGKDAFEQALEDADLVEIEEPTASEILSEYDLVREPDATLAEQEEALLLDRIDGASDEELGFTHYGRYVDDDFIEYDLGGEG